MSLPLRFTGAAVVAALTIAVVGLGWSRVRFGPDDVAATRKLESEVRDHVDRRSRQLRTLADAVAHERSLIDAAAASPEGLSRLFERIAALAADTDGESVSATVYVPGGGEPYRVLAWSDGPAGVVAADRLSGPPSLFVAPGAAAPGLAAPGTPGIRLIVVRPIDDGGRRIAVVETESVLSRANVDGVTTLPTTFGTVRILANYVGAGAIGPTEGFIIKAESGAALLEVRVDPALIAGARRTFAARVAAFAVLPLVVLLVVGLGPMLERRRRGPRLSTWLLWSAAACALLLAATTILVLVAKSFAAPGAVVRALLASGALACVAIGPGGLAWRRGRRRFASAAPVRCVVENLLAGYLLGVATILVASWLTRHITAGSLSAWQSALFPLALAELVDVWSVLLVVLALGWAIASVLAVMALRWRVSMRRPVGWLAATLWIGPLFHVMQIAKQMPAVPWIPLLPAVVFAAVLCALAAFAPLMRSYFRRTTQAMRLVLGFLALLAPLVAAYPLIATGSEATMRAVIEDDYGPATAGQADLLRRQVARAEQEIDGLVTLPDMVRQAPPAVVEQGIDSQLAFAVWRGTSLAGTRVVSDIELYGRDRTLVSRFSMNFPEYVGRTAAQTWDGTGCDWQVSGEVTRFGSVDRPMLHATRGLCTNAGILVGAVVIHVAPSDYQALPFLAAANPYADVFDADARARARPPRLHLVVYGWSLRPLFLSGRVAWSLDGDDATRLYREGRSFWTRLNADDRAFNVYLMQNRAGIYALGYPATTAFAHASRLAEIVAITAVLFVVVQVGALLVAPVVRRQSAPLRVLLHEVRTSFYRKLFLFFVLVAVGPAFVFAAVFGAYMTAKFRADVEAQASGVVTVARQVFEQVVSADGRAGGAVPPNDDVMVWIRQVIGQDVNLFEGAALRATSQRDLYNSGLLPTRTPASVYRRIALDRLPWFVAEDQQVLVAASPVSTGDQRRVLSVPLVSRQREIEEEMNDLGRGVLVGSVLVVLFSAGLGASLARRVSDPVARLTKATRQIAAGRLDVRIATDTADELKRLVDDFNSMAATLVAQRAELARANQLKAWNEMARQVAHEIKNPLTPIQLAAEHLQRVHEDRGRPLGDVCDQCVGAILGQVRLLRTIASEFSNFAGEPISRPETLRLAELVEAIASPYRLGLAGRIEVQVEMPPDLPDVRADRTLLTRALTNLIENAIQAMPMGGLLRLTADVRDAHVVLRIADTGVGMDAEARERAFEPYFSTKTGGSGLGLANAKRNIEREGGTVTLDSRPGEGTTVTVVLVSAVRPGARGSA